MSAIWTKDQLSAIESRNQNLLLSAAAGSGKTAVLVQRILSRITDKENPVKADRLLVVTFTNAAAAEMRERLLSRLTRLSEENPKDALLAEQLLLIKQAKITTIDSFCIDLLRQQFAAADLNPDFKIADPTEVKLLRAEVLEDVINDFYDDETYSETFLELLEMYANAKANDARFKKLIDSIYEFSMSLPNPVLWLTRAADEFGRGLSFSETTWCKVILEEVKTELLRAISRYELAISLAREDGLLAYETLLKEEMAAVKRILTLTNYDEVKSAVDEFAFGRRSAVPKNLTPKYFDYINFLREDVKDTFALLRNKYLVLSGKDQEEAIAETYPMMRCMSELVISLIHKFREEKRARNTLDFSDCEHEALKLLTDEFGNPSETAMLVKEQFDEIYIDEYQDTSRLQEAIFAAIQNQNNLFMVGDIKQSIYRFRNTDPSLFRDKHDTFLTEEEALNRKIVLSKNFRSRENVLSTVNFLFSRIMSRETGEIDYDEEQRLYPGLMYPETVSPINSDTEICLIDVDGVKEGLTDDVDAEKAEISAVFTADRIAELLESDYQVFDGGEYRPLEYRDICVIMRSKTPMMTLSSVLSERGIPCVSDGTGGFLESGEVSLLLAFLCVLDNPYQDLPLLSVLRSNLFYFTSDMLGRIRTYDRRGTFFDCIKKCAEEDSVLGRACLDFLNTRQEFFEKSQYLSLSELLLSVYHQTGFYESQQTKVNGSVRRANLDLLHERAKAFEATGFKGLYRFIRYLEDYGSGGGDFDSARAVVEDQNAVHLMTIHKSKGLEFPVVILFGAEKHFNTEDLRGSLLYHKDAGFGPKFIDTKRRIQYPFAPRIACEILEKRESIAEEMRILYVALTRAREKLIIVGAQKNIPAFVKRCASPKDTVSLAAGDVLYCRSYLEWITAAFISHPDCAKLRVFCDGDVPIFPDESHVKLSIIENVDMLLEKNAESANEIEQKPCDIDGVLSRVLFTYPNHYDTVLPSKITVTEVKRRTAEEDDGAYLFPRSAERKTFSGAITSAEIGTAYHTVFEKIDLSKALADVDVCKEEIARIKEAGFLTEDEEKAISSEKIATFFRQEIGTLMRSCENVHREVMFGIPYQANLLLDEFKSEKDIYLQGTIDCVIELDDELYILDYKTDRTESPKEMAEKYRVQLWCYGEAAERIFKKKVTKRIIYSLDKGLAVNIGE